MKLTALFAENTVSLYYKALLVNAVYETKLSILYRKEQLQKNTDITLKRFVLF